MSMRSMLFICALKLLKRTAKLTRINGRPDKLNRSVKDRNFSTKVVQISCFFFFNLNDAKKPPFSYLCCVYVRCVICVNVMCAFVVSSWVTKIVGRKIIQECVLYLCLIECACVCARFLVSMVLFLLLLMLCMNAFSFVQFVCLFACWISCV